MSELPTKRSWRDWARRWRGPLERPLVNYRQPLGILPTRKFWAHDDNFVRAQPIVLIACVPMVALLIAFPILFSWPYGLVIPLLWGELTLGLIERYIRKQAHRRMETRATAMLSGPSNPRDEQ